MTHHSGTCRCLNLNLCTCPTIFDADSVLFCASLFTRLRLNAVLHPNLGHSPWKSSGFCLFVFPALLGLRIESIETELEDYQLYSNVSSYNTCFVLRHHSLSFEFGHFFFLWPSLFPHLWPSKESSLIDFFKWLYISFCYKIPLVICCIFPTQL